jgi:IS5 family transposase
LKRINVNTTVQTKAIRFPTDARLYLRMRERLVKVARAEGLTIKQSYKHVGRCLPMQSSRSAHARQMKRASLHAQAEDAVGARCSRDRTASYRAGGEVSQITCNGASDPGATEA